MNMMINKNNSLNYRFLKINKNVAVKILQEGWVKKKPERITEVFQDKWFDVAGSDAHEA
jgi:chorismate-pyruvate lyase